MRLFLLAVWVLAVLFTGQVPAHAQGVTLGTERVEVEILPEWTSLPAEGGTVRIALRQKIIPGWHTYWSNPGDSGEPTKIFWEYDGRKESWSLPEGFSAGEMRYPHPERIPYGPLVNFGYTDEAVYLTSLTVPPGLTPGSEVPLQVRVRWLVCEEICIPEKVDTVLTFPVTAGGPVVDEWAKEVIDSASFPQESPWPARFNASDGKISFGVDAPDMQAAFDAGAISQAVFFPHRDGYIANASPQSVSFGEGGFSVSTDAGFRFSTEGMTPPDEISGVLVITDTSSGKPVDRAMKVKAVQGALPMSWAAHMLGPDQLGGAVSKPTMGWLEVALFAVLGGLILNLMPCVFPVLFIKAFGIVNASQKPQAHVRLHGAVFTAGVVVSFALVGVALLALRAGGEQIGWGFQLQSPVFVTLLVYLLLAVGLSLSGVFSLGQSVANIGSGSASNDGLSGAFFTGVLASVVATPCTAPFMGAAIGFSLTQPWPLALMVFVLLGFGMALPWLALSFSPQLIRLLPKPGAWMETAKHLLAFPVYATALWLLWVLVQQVSPAMLAAVFTGALCIAFAAWVWGAQQAGSAASGWRWPSRAVAGVMVIAALGLLSVLQPVQRSGSAQARVQSAGGALRYEAFSQARLDELRSQGTPVFVNATAAWCITCLFNERVALSSASLAEQMETAGVVALKADWTNQDAEITRFLERFGRSGVPLYVFFPTGSNSEPVVLPQMLTEAAVLKHIESAGSGGPSQSSPYSKNGDDI